MVLEGVADDEDDVRNRHACCHYGRHEGDASHSLHQVRCKVGAPFPQCAAASWLEGPSAKEAISAGLKHPLLAPGFAPRDGSVGSDNETVRITMAGWQETAEA